VKTPRTSLALLLTAAAVAVPCAAWYAVGWREANRQATEIEHAPQRLAREAALRLADRLRDRLDTLRENESKRPFYHYQNYYHDPRGAYEGVAVVPSPLSQGPLDPLIRTYFQLDASGRFALPQLNELAPPEAGQQATDTTELQDVRRQLEINGATFVAIVNQPVRPPPATPPSVAQPASRIQSRRVEVLESQAFSQNVSAQDVYSQLRNTGQVSPKAQRNVERIKTEKGNVQIGVGPFRWHTINIDRVPSLVALREVQTPIGRNVQGFLISAAGITDILRAAPFPAHFDDGAPQHATDVALPLDNDLWHVSVDAGIDLAAARTEAHKIRRSFLHVFAGGTAAAIIAGLCVVGLVWQTDRLARQRSQFAASAAHELRTPLAGLRLYSDMLADGLGNPDSARQYARRIADEAERLGRVVANVLGFSRLERGTLNVHPEPGDLAAAVHNAVARQLPALEAAGAKVELTLAGNLPPVKFDRDALSQILQNLLDNAEKHTRQAENRTISISLAGCSGASVKRRPFPTGNDRRPAKPPLQQSTHVELTIADHGPGVTRKTRRKLFQPFVRGDQPDAPAGIGLGLVLVKTLTEAQGGTVAYRDNDGGGARFVVTLPV
jgi:signal transduction histidine kinase